MVSPSIYFPIFTISLTCASGEFHGGIETPPRTDFEKLIAFSDEEDGQIFFRLIRKMLLWNPQDRQTAKQLLDDEWVRKHFRL